MTLLLLALKPFLNWDGGQGLARVQGPSVPDSAERRVILDHVPGHLRQGFPAYQCRWHYFGFARSEAARSPELVFCAIAWFIIGL